MKFDKKSLTLYAVTDRAWTGRLSFLEQIEAALKGGATSIQLREKDLPDDKFLEEALLVKKLCQKYNVLFYINDNVEVAVKCGADGIHIGQHDMPVKEARRLIGPDMILGVSAQTVEQAVKAQKDGADYLGVGAVFPTGTKKDADDVSLSTLRDICLAVDIPVVAIGGISKNNILQLKNTGIYGAAVVSAIFAQTNIEESTRELLKLAEKISMPDFDGTIFDVDGTVLDSMPYWSNIDSFYLEKLGVQTDEDLTPVFFTKTLEESCAFLREHFSLPQSAEQIRKIVIDCINNFYAKEIPLKKEIVPYLEKLKRQNIPMVIATAGDKECVKLAFKRLGILDYFSCILTTADVGSGKESPEIFYEAAKKIGTKIEKTIVFEDSLHAIKTAKKAGFIIAGIYDEASKKAQKEIIELSDLYIEENK